MVAQTFWWPHTELPKSDTTQILPTNCTAQTTERERFKLAF